MLNPRERRLLTLVLTVLGAYAAYGLLQWFVLEPMRARQAQLASLESEINRKRLQQRQVLQAQEQYQEWLKKSLPSDISRAQSLYQEFLLTAVSSAGLSETAVTTMPPSPQGDIMVRLPYTVRGRGSLSELVELLRYFYGVDVLHQIRQLNVRRRDGGDDLDIEMRVEAVALRDAPDALEQPLRPTPESLAALGIDSEMIRLIRDKNILSPYRPPSPDIASTPATPTEPAAPQLDPAEFVYAVGRVVVGTAVELWIYDRLNNELHRVSEGETFDVAGVRARVVKVTDDGAVLAVSASPAVYRFLRLGSNLRQMEEYRQDTEQAAREDQTTDIALSARPE